MISKNVFIFGVLLFFGTIFGCAEIPVTPTPKTQPPPTVLPLSEKEDMVGEIARGILKDSEGLTSGVIAVVEFTDLDGKESRMGKLLTERLITRLVDSKEVEVIERSQLNKVLEELKLSLSGVVDSASAQKIGQVLGVEAIVSGTIVDLKDKWEVNARMINTETGAILSAATVQGKMEGEVPKKPLRKEKAPLTPVPTGKKVVQIPRKPGPEKVDTDGDGIPDTWVMVGTRTAPLAKEQVRLMRLANKHHRLAVKHREKRELRRAREQLREEVFYLRKVVSLNPDSLLGRKAQKRLRHLKIKIRRIEEKSRPYR